jgi:class 3 adenylate cyclase
MTEESGRTLVCSVLFIDIVAYSTRPVTDQFEIKREFNAALGGALEVLTRRDRVIVDTGDGAAIVFLGDPEDALVVGVAMREHAGRIPMRMGINLGPVRLISDLNDQTNVIGDGINVAQRVMAFAEPGQLLVSSNYHDVISRMSAHYATLFTKEGRRQDKHVRDYEVYGVSDALRIEGKQALLDDPAEEARATAVYRAPEAAAPARGPAAHEPAKVLDAGDTLMVSGSSRASVAEAVARLLREGASVISPVTMAGSRWVASCSHTRLTTVVVEEAGLMRIVKGASRESVDAKAAELIGFGGRLVQPAELVDGVWTAVCDTAS